MSHLGLQNHPADGEGFSGILSGLQPTASRIPSTFLGKDQNFHISYPIIEGNLKRRS